MSNNNYPQVELRPGSGKAVYQPPVLTELLTKEEILGGASAPKESNSGYYNS